MLDFIGETGATFVTNAVAHAQRLAAKGAHVLLVGGTLKSSTEAVVGTMAALTLKDYHFSKGFFGANGVSKAAGFTTPDANEALVKEPRWNNAGKHIFCAITASSILSVPLPLLRFQPEQF